METKAQTGLVICLGDLTDQKIWSNWPKDTDDFSPSDEFKEADKVLRRMHKMFLRWLSLEATMTQEYLERQ